MFLKQFFQLVPSYLSAQARVELRPIYLQRVLFFIFCFLRSVTVHGLKLELEEVRIFFSFNEFGLSTWVFPPVYDLLKFHRKRDWWLVTKTIIKVVPLPRSEDMSAFSFIKRVLNCHSSKSCSFILYNRCQLPNSAGRANMGQGKYIRIHIEAWTGLVWLMYLRYETCKSWGFRPIFPYVGIIDQLTRQRHLLSSRIDQQPATTMQELL